MLLLAAAISHFFQLFAFALKLGKQTYILDLLTSVNLEHVGNRENVEENHISVKQQFYKSHVDYHFWEQELYYVKKLQLRNETCIW